MTRLAECWKTARKVEGPSVGLGDPVAAALEVLEQRAAAAVVVLGDEDGRIALPPRPGALRPFEPAGASELQATVLCGARVAMPAGGFIRRGLSVPVPSTGLPAGLSGPCRDCRTMPAAYLEGSGGNRDQALQGSSVAAAGRSWSRTAHVIGLNPRRRRS